MPTTSKAKKTSGPKFAELPPQAKFKVIKFGAKWCHFCTIMKNKKTLERLQERHPEITVEEVDVDKDDARADAYGVKGLPLTVIEDEEGHELVRQGTALSLDEMDKLYAKATRKWKPKGQKPDKKTAALKLAGPDDEDNDDEDVDLDEEGEIDDLNEDDEK